jgi:AAA ATPase domain
MTASRTGADANALAGRAAELSILRAAAEAAQAGRFSAVLISGEPGIGKSRLTEEVRTYARALGFETAAGRCFDAQSRVSYFPFIQAFRYLSKHPSSSITPAEQRLAAKRAGQTADVISRLTLGAPRATRPKLETAGAMQTALFESVVCFLRDRSRLNPLLLVLEDLDWADDGSLSLLVHLLRMLTETHLLIIATCRGQTAAQGPELARAIAEYGRHHYCERIRLKGLPEPEAASLIEYLLGSDYRDEAKRLASDINQLANGNPLFIHEIVRHLIETGRLSESKGQGTSPAWESKLAAQDGMRELVDARLSRLSGGCRNTLSQAAVLGDEFEFDVLAQMLPLAARDLADFLDEASSAGIIVDARSEAAADYAFAHGLIRQSLYERQSRPAKRRLHAEAAYAIEVLHRSDLAAYFSQLALHYTRAGRTGDLAKACEYSARAGEMAFAVSSYADAVCHWRNALKLVSPRDRKVSAQLMERLGEASLLSAATPAEAAHYLRGALKLYAELGEEADAARVHARLVTVFSLLSMNPAPIHVGQAVSHSRVAEKLLAIRADPGAESELLIGEALVAHAQFRTEDGLVASERAMEIGRQDTGIWCQAASWHGHFLWARGKVNEGLGLMEQAFERAGHSNDPKPRFAAAWLLSFSYLLLWDPAAAERTIQEALAESDTSQVEYFRQMLSAHLGIANVFAGRLTRARSLLTIAPHRFLEANLRFFEGEWPQTEELLNQQIERSRIAQAKQQHWTASLWLARLKRIQADNAGALELLTNTPLIAEALLRVPEEIATRSELALVRLARGEFPEARSEIRRCRSLLNAGEDWRALPAFVDRAEAALLGYEGFFEQASRLWISAGKVFSQYQLPWEVAETLITWGILMLRYGKAEEGAAKLGAAAQIYRHLELGIRWDSRIQELLGRARILSVPNFDAPAAGTVRANTAVPTAATVPSGDIHSIVTTHDMALLATLIHDAIAHLMNAIDKAAKMRAPIERIAAATEKISRISTPVERLARALEQAARNSVSAPHGESQRTRPGRRLKLNRSHDPGRPL